MNFGPRGSLVTFTTSDGLELDGILYLAHEGAPTILHVHGSFGNFYQNPFVRILAESTLASGINLLAFNTSCHDGLAEGNLANGDMRYIGGAVSPFEGIVQDITAALEFVRLFSPRPILQGHSLGCDRVVHYLLESGAEHPCILISPCDSQELQRCWLGDESVEHQIERLRELPSQPGELEWVAGCEYGVKVDPLWTYRNPITRRALLSILTGPPFHLFRYHGGERPWRINSPALVVVGSNDGLLTAPPEAVIRYFTGRFSSVESLVVNGADHMLARSEVSVAQHVCTWVGRQKEEPG